MKCCACYPKCKNPATHTPNSPYMDDFCDECTYERHDITFDVHLDYKEK